MFTPRAYRCALKLFQRLIQGAASSREVSRSCRAHTHVAVTLSPFEMSVKHDGCRVLLPVQGLTSEQQRLSLHKSMLVRVRYIFLPSCWFFLTYILDSCNEYSAISQISYLFVRVLNVISGIKGGTAGPRPKSPWLRSTLQWWACIMSTLITSPSWQALCIHYGSTLGSPCSSEGRRGCWTHGTVRLRCFN